MATDAAPGEVITFIAEDHPQANGRRAKFGEQQWTISFTLEDGRRLDVLIGKTGHAALRAMLIQEMRDDEWEEG